MTGPAIRARENPVGFRVEVRTRDGWRLRGTVESVDADGRLRVVSDRGVAFPTPVVRSEVVAVLERPVVASSEQPRCLECGAYFESVGVHAQKAHGLTADEYREKHGLYRQVALCSEQLSARRSSDATKLREGGHRVEEFTPKSGPRGPRPATREAVPLDREKFLERLASHGVKRRAAVEAGSCQETVDAAIRKDAEFGAMVERLVRAARGEKP